MAAREEITKETLFENGIPQFTNEDEERKFWASHDSTVYADTGTPVVLEHVYEDEVEEIRATVKPLTKQEELREGIARNAYLWDMMRSGVSTINPFEELTEYRKKPYLVLAEQSCIFLHSEGLRLPNGEALVDEANG